MKALLAMLNMSKYGGVQEDAFMAVGTLIECIGQHFMKYFDIFKPFLIQGLQNRAEYQVLNNICLFKNIFILFIFISLALLGFYLFVCLLICVVFWFLFFSFLQDKQGYRRVF